MGKDKMKIEVSGDDLDLEKKDEKYADRLDVIKHALEIHSKKSKITKDYVLFCSTPEEREFMMKMQKCAYQASFIFPDKEVAEMAYQALINENVMLSVLRRNERENPILGKILDPDEGESQQQNGESIIDKIRGMLPGGQDRG